MKTIIIVLIGLNLGWIVFQDFSERKVSLYALILLLALCIVHYCLAFQIKELLLRILVNSLFAGIILVSGTLLVKLRRPKDSVSSFIGTGDFLFLCAISPMFSFDAYLVFLNTSIILVLLSFGLISIISKSRQKISIPLAGALSICLFITLLINELLSSNLLDDINWIYLIL